MIERGTGRIISVSSVIGETGNIGQANYAASKSGLFGLTKSLAREAIFQLNRAQRPAGDGIGVTVGTGLRAAIGRAPPRGRAAGRPPIPRCSARRSRSPFRLRGGRGWPAW
jgi:NAD(P)-dependent dehydrogenase (short-subunit alcohol dehydrogenase family)